MRQITLASDALGYPPHMTRPAAPPESDDEFASGALVALITRALHEHAPHLVPPTSDTATARPSARSSLARKRELLECAHREFGGAFVFGIGAGIGAFRGHPILEAFLRSAGGDVLLGKWGRFERYAHARHRTRIEERAPGDYEIRHHALRGGAPGPAHDLFVLGVITALLEALGVRRLCVSLLPGDLRLVHAGRRVEIDAETLRTPTDRWRLSWIERDDTSNAAASDPDGGPMGFAARAQRLFAADPARCWSVSQLAALLGVAPRSLQRALLEEGTSYSSLLRTARVGEACRLIETTPHPMTVIAYVCGFSDAAHLSREFRVAVGSTPTQFREVVRPVPTRTSGESVNL